jgi:hypothetical protein
MYVGNTSSPPIEVDEPFDFETNGKKLQDSECVLVKRWETDFSFPECEDQDVVVPKMKLYPNVTFDISLEVENVYLEDEEEVDRFGQPMACPDYHSFNFTFKNDAESATAYIHMLVSICILDLEKQRNKVLVEWHDMEQSLKKSPTTTEWEIEYYKRVRESLRLQLVIKIPSDAKGTQDAMSKWFGQDMFSDFNVVAADGTIFKCHKIVLFEKSDFFSKYFKKNAKAESVKINVEATTMKALLRFIYQGLVHHNEATVGLLTAANIYQLPVLVDLCAMNFTRNLSVETAIDVFVACNLLKLKSYTKEAKTFISKNSKTIMAGQPWKKLKAENPTLTAELHEFCNAAKEKPKCPEILMNSSSDSEASESEATRSSQSGESSAKKSKYVIKN